MATATSNAACGAVNAVAEDDAERKAATGVTQMGGQTPLGGLSDQCFYRSLRWGQRVQRWGGVADGSRLLQSQSPLAISP